MAISNQSGTKCPKCEKTKFELVEDFPRTSTFKMYYIRCSSCKIFLQALPYFDTNSKLDVMQQDIENIKRKLDVYP